MAEVMNTICTNFQQIVKNLVLRHGRDVLWEKRFTNLLYDGIKGAFNDEAELFLLALDGGLADQIRDLRNIRKNELLKFSGNFSAEYCVRDDHAREIIQLLVSLIHKKSISLDDEWMYTRRRK
jgi:hypothetical protein